MVRLTSIAQSLTKRKGQKIIRHIADFTIDPGEYRIVSGWEKVALEIRSSSGKDETVKFDEADHEEKIELHAGDEVSVVSLDGQDNYLAMYQIQQYDE